MARHTVLMGALTSNGMKTETFYAIQGGTWGRTLDLDRAGICPVTGTVLRLKLTINTAAVGTCRFVLYKNGAATELCARITAGNTEGSDLTNEVSITGGDQWALYYTGDTGIYAYWTLEVDCGLANFSLITAGGSMNRLAPATAYFPLHQWGNGEPMLAAENECYCVAPIACTISSLYIKQTGASYPAGATVTITLRVNGADTELTATATGPESTASDLIHTVAITQGDRVCWSCAVSGADQPIVSLGALIKPAVENLQMAVWIAGDRTTDLDTGGTYYTFPLISDAWGICNVLNHNELRTRGNARIGNLYVALSAAPGLAASGKSYTFTLLVNGAPSALTCTVLEIATVAEDAVNLVDLADGDLVALQETPANTPNASRASWGLVLYGLTPTFTSITPNSGMIGSQFQVSIIGTNLEDTGEIDLGEGITATVLSASATEVTATIAISSSAVLGARDVTVQTAAGSATLAGGFTVIANPATEVGVTTSPVTDIRGPQATLNAYLDENAGTPAQAWFEWGATIKYGESTPKQTVYYKGGSFSAIISPLTPGGYYHVRAVIQTEQGTFYGNDTGFSAQVQPHLASLINDDALMRLMD
jgi:hypothetical protein